MSQAEKKKWIPFLLQVEEKLKSGWTQGTAARSKSGKVVAIDSLSAARFCIIGAVEAVKHPPGFRAEVFNLLASNLPEPKLLSLWNDTKGRKKNEVVGLVRKTREQLEGEKK